MEDNLFNELFGDDFFKKHLMNLDYKSFLDENGQIDYQKINKESLKFIDSLVSHKRDLLSSDESTSISDILSSINEDKVGMGFIQDLTSDEGSKVFDELIQKNGLVKDLEIIDIAGVDYVSECWTNKDNTVNIKRIYRLSDASDDILTVSERIALYERRLNSAVSVENYEQAAILRDKIKLLNEN